MREYGLVENVYTTSPGSLLQGDTTTGATSVVVANSADFSADGGMVLVNGMDVYNYTAVDFFNNIITLDSGISALPDGTEILEYPVSEIKYADVSLGSGGDSITVEIPTNESVYFEDGFRDIDEKEEVEVELRGSKYYYLNTFNIKPQIATEFIPALTTDTLPPMSSPTPTVLGGVGIIKVRWISVTNEDPVTYDVYISTDPNFIPSAATLATSTAGISATIGTLPDGSAILNNVTYYVKLIARDDDGSAPVSSGAGTSTHQITGDDIAVNYLYAGNILANQIIGGTVQSDLLLSGNIKTATVGARIELGPFGLVGYGSNGSANVLIGSDGSGYFKGVATLSNLTVTDGMSIRGISNEFSRGSKVTLASSTTAPTTAPNPVVDFESYPLKNADGSTLSSVPSSLAYVNSQFIAPCADQVTRRFTTTGAFHSTQGRVQTKSNYTQIAASQPGYFMIDSGYLYRDIDTNSIDGDRFQFNETFDSALTTNWTTQGGVAISSAKAVFSPAQSPTATNSAKLTSKSTFNMRGHALTFEVATSTQYLASSQRVDFTLQIDASNYVRLSLAQDQDSGIVSPNPTGTSIEFQTCIAGNTLTSADPIVVANYTKLRIAENNGNFIFRGIDTSGALVVLETLSHTFTAAQLAACSIIINGVDNSAAGNIIVNPSFETNTTGWYETLRSSMTRVTTQAQSGSASLQVTSTSTGTVGVSTAPDSFASANYYRVTPGQVITVTAYSKAATVAREMFQYMRTYDADGTNFTSDTTAYTTSTVFDTTTGWTAKTVVFTIPSGAAWARFQFGWLNCPKSEVHYLDSVNINVAPFTATIDNVTVGWSLERVALNRSNTSLIPALGNNSTNLLQAELNSDKTVVIKEIDPGDMTTVLNTWTSAAVSSLVGPLKSVMVGGFDFTGGPRFIVKDSGNGDFYSFTITNSTTISTVLNESFPADTGGSAGAVWDGSVFQALGTNGVMYKRTPIVWNDAGSIKPMSVAYSWYDNDTIGGMHETLVSPRSTFNMAKRGRLTITGGTIPDQGGSDDPNSIKVYVGNSSVATLYLQGTYTADGVNTITFNTLTFSGTGVPTSNNFPSATPAQIVSTTGNMIISGNDSITVPNLIVTSSATLPAKPIGRYNKNTAQVIATATSSVVQLNVNSQLAGMTWDATNFNFVIGTAGRYLISASVCYAATPPAACRIESSIRINGTDVVLRTIGAPVITNSYPSAGETIIRDLSVGDTVALTTYQNSGSNFSTHTNVNATYLELTQV